jgi:poly-gamma-glutamate synthesis protein (capsule biosynthesis protein)
VNVLYSDYDSVYQKVDREKITSILSAVAKEKPDIVIALLHWGSEFNNTISASQKEIVSLMQDNGVDAIIGTHSHYVQKVDYDRDKGTVIAYSLGDLYGDAEKAGTNYSILLQLQITRNNQTGETKITGCDYIPVYTLTPERDEEPMQVVRLAEAMAQYEYKHIGCVNETAYQNMKAALAKIQSKTGLDK